MSLLNKFMIMKLKIISFGSNEEYINLAEKTVQSVKNLYSKSETKVFKPKDLPYEINDYAKIYSRGYGYWIWKPYIIKEALCKINENDILLYLDGRSGLRKTGKPIRWLDSFILENKFDIASWQMIHKEMSWTNGDIISAFNLDLNSELVKTGQFAATFHAWRKNIRSLNFLNEWLKFLLDNREICRDEVSQNLNHKKFIGNRHDQSVFSLMIKTKIVKNDSIAFKKAELLLDRIINNQSEEGWFREYEGADPGYQTLCLHYLVDAHLKSRALNLSEPIAKSIRFLQYFAHPDGSFGGHYGSRCTRFYYQYTKIKTIGVRYKYTRFSTR